MKKQTAISAFFKPKTSNVAKEASKPKKSNLQKKVETEDQKENLSEKVERMDIEELPKSSKMSSRDEEVVKKRRKVILDSSDEDELPKVKRPRTGLNKSLASSSEDEDHDEDEDDDNESNSSSALSDADLQEEEEKEDGISEDELEFLKRDAERHNLDKQGSRPRRRKRSPVRRKAKIESESDDDEEPGPSSPVKTSPKKSPKSKDIKKEKKTEAKKKVVKKEAGSRADNSQDKFPFESASNEEPSEESPKKKSPAKKVKSSPKKTAKKSPKKEEVKKEASSPKTKPMFGQQQKSSAKTTDYDPTKGKYDPLNDACWKAGEPVPYYALAATLAACEDNSGRLAKTEYLANFLLSVNQLSPDDLLPAVHLSLNLLSAAYEGVELGIGDHILMKAIAQATGRSIDKLKKQMEEVGDLGSIAENSKGMQKMMFQPKPLKLSHVYKKLQEVADISGGGNQQKKVSIISGCLVACKGPEARFLIRSCTGKLRVGVSESTVLAAIARAFHIIEYGKYDKEKCVKSDDAIKTAFCELPNFEILLKTVQEHGLKNLDEHISLHPGVPLKPMLAHPTKDMSEILKRFGDDCEFTGEYKYDGERAQIHVNKDGSMNIFSRNQENNTSKYPDIISRMPSAFVDVQTAIIDSECVAWDPEKKQILPFQVLTTRKKKDVDAKDIKVQVCVYAFDLLYLNGKSLVREPLSRRRELLRSNFKEVEGEFLLATSKDFTSLEDVSEFLDEAVKDSTEGLMVKALDETYEISKRSHNWLKLKKDYLGEGVGDSIDLVVIGAYNGKGKRSGNYGGFLLACYNPDEEEYQSICKIGTGFTDENLEKFTAQLKTHVCSKKSYYRMGSLACDHYFEPEVVWEIKCADLSISPAHCAAAGLVDPTKGISLRFPRFIRVRDDKKADDATTADQIAEMYNSQGTVL